MLVRLGGDMASRGTPSKLPQPTMWHTHDLSSTVIGEGQPDNRLRNTELLQYRIRAKDSVLEFLFESRSHRDGLVTFLAVESRLGNLLNSIFDFPED